MAEARLLPSTTGHWRPSRAFVLGALAFAAILAPAGALLGAAPAVAIAIGVTFLGLVTHSVRPRTRRATEARPNRRAEPRVSVKAPPQVSVVIPALNEAENVGQVLRRLPSGLHEVVLVDGGSSDDTVRVARGELPSIRIVRQPGRGKGDALQAGFASVTGNVIVTLDADGSTDPAEIPRFVDCLRRGADFAKGSRFIEGGGSADITILRRAGNRALVMTVNVLFGTRYSDLCYGYNAFWTECLPHISLDVPGFEVETVINTRVAKANLVVSEVPSFELRRLSGKSNLKTFRDGFRVLSTIIRESPVHPKTRQQRPRAQGATTPAAADGRARNV